MPGAGTSKHDSRPVSFLYPFTPPPCPTTVATRTLLYSGRNARRPPPGKTLRTSRYLLRPDDTGQRARRVVGPYLVVRRRKDLRLLSSWSRGRADIFRGELGRLTHRSTAVFRSSLVSPPPPRPQRLHWDLAMFDRTPSFSQSCSSELSRVSSNLS